MLYLELLNSIYLLIFLGGIVKMKGFIKFYQRVVDFDDVSEYMHRTYTFTQPFRLVPQA